MGCGSSRGAYGHDRRAYHGVAMAPVVRPITPGSAALAPSAASHGKGYAMEDHAGAGGHGRADCTVGHNDVVRRQMRRRRIAEWRQNTLGIVRQPARGTPPKPRYDHLTKFGTCQLGMVDELSTCTYCGDATQSDGATRSSDHSQPSSLSTSGCTTFVNHAAPPLDPHLFSTLASGGEATLMLNVSAGAQKGGAHQSSARTKTPSCGLSPTQASRPSRRLQRYALEACSSGHAHRVKVALLVPQADVVLSCSTVDRHMTAYHVHLRTEVGRLVGHDDVILGGAVSPDGRVVATASRDGTAILWELPSCKQRRSLPHPAAVHACRFSATGAEVATVCADSRCRVWTWADTDVVNTLVSTATGFDAALTTLAYSMGDRHLLAGGAANAVFVWDRQRFAEAAVGFHHHRSAVLAVEASHAHHGVVVSADERSVYVWRCETLAVLHSIEADQCGVPRHRLRRTTATSAADLSSFYWTAVRLADTHLGVFVVAGASDRCVHVFQVDGVDAQAQEGVGEATKFAAESKPMEVLCLPLSSSLSAADGVLSNAIVLGDTCGNRHILSLS